MTPGQAKTLLQNRASIETKIMTYDHLINHVFKGYSIAGKYTQEQSEAKQLLSHIDDSIMAIPKAKCREVLRMRYIEGLEWKQVQSNMGYFTIKSIYRNANIGYSLFASEFEKLEAESPCSARICS